MFAYGNLSQADVSAALAQAGLGVVKWFPQTGECHAEGAFDAFRHRGVLTVPHHIDGWLKLLHPEDQALWQSTLDGVRNGRRPPQDWVVRVRNAQGIWSWFALTAAFQTHSNTPEQDAILITWQDISRRKQVEAALRDSQIRYRALYSTSPLAFILWDKEGRITEWNQRAQTLFGWSANEVIGQHVHRLLIAPPEITRFRQTISDLNRRHGNGSLTCWTLTKSGETRFCNWHNVTLRNTGGTLTGVMSLINDITDRQEGEESLRKSEKAYRTLVETSPDAILLLALDGSIQMANQEAQRLFGLDMLDGLSNTKLEHLVADHNDTAMELLGALAEPGDFSGIVVNRTLRLHNIRGDAFTAEISFTSIFDEQGTPEGLVLFARDVTAKLQADAELQKHQTQLQALVQERTRELETAHAALAEILEGSPVPTFVLDANHVISHWNQACEKIIGMRAVEMIGTRDQWRAFYPEARPVLADLVMDGSSQDIAALYGEHLRPSYLIDGAYEGEDYFPNFRRWMAFTAAPLKDKAGNIIGAIETLQDITERKLAEEYLLEAKQMAESAARAKAEFLANMSHEIRTPMNAVIGLAHILLKTELSPRQREQVERIRGAGRMLLGLINDILDFSKIEAGRMTLEITDFDLDELLDGIATVVLAQAQSKHLELNYVVAPDVPHQLQGDSLRLAQVFVNLIGNAIKFTERGGVTVNLTARQVDAQRVQLQAEIRDTGIGMSQEQQQRLFQAFSQADTSITRKFGGTGLGLTISKRLVELMGGTIRVSSQPGAGSTFSFDVMLGLGQARAPVVSPPLRDVLVVDDNALAATVLARLFERNGCTATIAASGEEALEHLERGEQFDCITLDFSMPGMQGPEVARAIRQRAGKQPYLLLVTARDTSLLENDQSLEQFDEILNKPVTATQLHRVLHHLASGDAPAPATGEALAGMRVLLADDIPTNQLIAQEILESFGISVDLASNGLEVLQKLETQTYDLVLMDIQMPELDGIEATHRLREDARWQSLPVLAMTAHAFDEERQRCMAAGMNDFLTKPIDPELLHAALARWHKVPGSAPSPRPTLTPPSFPDLPGIDTAEGLRRMMNKPALYAKVLKDFQQRFRDEATVIRTALAAGDREMAHRSAHSVKGLAGSIGAAALQAAALKLENAIRDGNPQVPEALDSFTTHLREVIDGLTAYHSA